MSKYTITIKNLIDNNFDFKMTSYPIFDENYRNTLNQNILNHYYEDEIGFETAPLFRHYLNQTLNEIMPKYNVLYLAQKEILDKKLLMTNVNLTENLDGSNTTETQNQSSSESNGKNLFQDTPQGKITQSGLDNQEWATNVTFNKNDINDESSSTGSGTNTYLKTIVGSNGGKYSSEILNDIYNNFMSIDLMIINDLSDLFMQIY